MDNTDCDDTDGTINPAATETCDGVDDNCSGDENDATDATTYYADVDDDKFGDPDNTQNLLDPVDTAQPTPTVMTAMRPSTVPQTSATASMTTAPAMSPMLTRW